MAAEQIREGHLAAGPGGHRGALAGGGLHLGGHLPQPHEFQLAAGEEEHIAGLEPADERLLDMADHRSAHKAHGHRAVRGDRADVEAVQPGDGLVDHPVAIPLPLQLAVARIGPQAAAPVLEHLQAPLPLAVRELLETPAAAHRGQLLLGLKPRAAGQGGEVLQQHIQWQLGRPPVLHQPLLQPAAHGTHLQ